MWYGVLANSILWKKWHLENDITLIFGTYNACFNLLLYTPPCFLILEFWSSIWTSHPHCFLKLATSLHVLFLTFLNSNGNLTSVFFVIILQKLIPNKLHVQHIQAVIFLVHIYLCLGLSWYSKELLWRTGFKIM